MKFLTECPYPKTAIIFGFLFLVFSASSMPCEQTMAVFSLKESPLVSQASGRVVISNIIVKKHILNEKEKLFINIKSYGVISQEFKQFVKLLESRIGAESAVESILNSIDFLSDFRFEYVLQRIEIFEDILGYEGVNELLKAHLPYFIRVTFYKHSSRLGRSNQFLSLKDETTEHENVIRGLNSIIERIKYYVRDEQQLKQVVKKSLSSLFSAHIAGHFHSTASYVESHLGRKGVEKKIIKSLAQFQNVTAASLAHLEQEWGGYVMARNLRRYSLSNVHFKRGEAFLRERVSLKVSAEAQALKEEVIYMEELLIRANNMSAAGEHIDLQYGDFQSVERLINRIEEKLLLHPGKYDPEDIKRASQLRLQLSDILHYANIRSDTGIDYF